MTEFIKAAFSILPSAASSPLSLSAYAIAIFAWLIIALRVNRNKQVLAHLEKLPENDRLTALELEMGVVRVQVGLTAEQWIKLKTQSYYFLGFAVICLALVVVFVVAAVTKSASLLYYFLGFAVICLILTCVFALTAFRKNSKVKNAPSADITLFQEEGGEPYHRQTQAQLNTHHQPNRGQVVDEPKPVSSMPQTHQDHNKYQVTDIAVLDGDDGSGGYLPLASGDCTLTYAYTRVDKKIWIKPQMPYLDLLAAGGPIRGLRYWWSPFSWQFPKLSVKIVNNGDSTVLLSEAVINVITSKINIEPVLIIEENYYNVGHFRIINEGWGQVIDPIITFKIMRADRGTAPEDNDEDNEAKSQEQTIQASTFDKTTNVSIIDCVPESLRNDRLVVVSGNIQFHTENQEKRVIQFKTTVSLVHPGPGLPRPPTYLYDLFLKAGQSGYTKHLPISQEIKPGESDHFLIRVASDKSAQFDLAFSFRATGGMEIHSDEVILDMFVPRSQLGGVRAKNPGEFELEK